jgi:rod shape determining protein RodA
MNQRNSYLAKGADRSLLWLWFILSLIGVISIFSATYRDGDNILQGFLSLRTDYSRQALFLLISGIAGIFILLTDSKFFTATANLSYAFGILLMLLVFPFHSNVKGTSSIIRLGSAVQIQPADICKIFVNLALAKYLSRVETDFAKPRSQLIAAVIALVPAGLSIMQRKPVLPWFIFHFSWSCSGKDYPHWC